MDLCNPKEIKALFGPPWVSVFQADGPEFPDPGVVPGRLRRPQAQPWGRGAGDRSRHWPADRSVGRRGEKVVSVELDRTLLPILAETLSDYDNVEIVPGTS